MRQHPRSRGFVILAALAACRPSGPPALVATDHVTLPPSYMFQPAAITVPAGTRVTWSNADHFTHSIRLLDEGVQPLILKPGDSTSFTFTTPGTFKYDCSFHPHDMHGEVIVTPAH